MFENYIYMISALLLCSSHPMPKESGAMPAGSLFFLFFSSILYFFIVRIVFARLEKIRTRGEGRRADLLFGKVMTRLSMLAILFFFFEIYFFDLKGIFAGMAVFRLLPSVLEFLVMLVFLAHLAVIWFFAHRTYVGLSLARISKRAYLFSNISFVLPVLMPWFLFVLVPDLVRLLPFEAPGRLLGSETGSLVYYVLFFSAALLTGPFLVVRLWGCRPLPAGDHRERIAALCRKAGVAYADICSWPIFGGRLITAGVMGVWGRFRYIMVTPALLECLDGEELDAVIAHEIGHVKMRHLLLYVLIFLGFIVLAGILADPAMLLFLSFKPLGLLILKAGRSGSGVISALIGLVMVAFLLVYLRYLFGYFMRNFERQADLFVYSLMGSGAPLIRTFSKIVRLSGQDPDKPNWHHFSLSRRIGFLEKCEANREFVGRHHRKVKVMLTVFTLCLFSGGLLAYSINQGKIARVLEDRYRDRLYALVMEGSVESSGLYDMLAMAFYDSGDLVRAVAAYRKSISIEPRNAHALNNLAWLYATSRDPRFRNPGQAVRLAERALAVDRSPHVMDTLAESYHAAGRFEEAIRLEEEALAKALGDKTHYRMQLERFRLGRQGDKKKL